MGGTGSPACCRRRKPPQSRPLGRSGVAGMSGGERAFQQNRPFPIRVGLDIARAGTCYDWIVVVIGRAVVIASA